MAATPRMREAAVFFSLSRTDTSERSMVSIGKPADWMRMTLSSFLPATAITSRLTPAASTRPCWWSVWLPPTSVRPGALKSPTSRPAPKSFSNSPTAASYRSRWSGAFSL